MQETDGNVIINIDTKEFLNPFVATHRKNQVESMILYHNFFRTPVNHGALRLIGDKKIYSEEDDYSFLGWTRSEVLQSLACLFGYRQKLATTKRDLLDIDYGLIVQQVRCDRNMSSGLSLAIRRKWPIVYERYQLVRVMNPGALQLVRVNSDRAKYPLFVLNIFGREKDEDNKNKTRVRAIRNALKKVQKIRFMEGLYLPIYFPYRFGCQSIQEDWTPYEQLLLKYCSDAIICDS